MRSRRSQIPRHPYVDFVERIVPELEGKDLVQWKRVRELAMNVDPLAYFLYLHQDYKYDVRRAYSRVFRDVRKEVIITPKNIRTYFIAMDIQKKFSVATLKKYHKMVKDIVDFSYAFPETLEPIEFEEEEEEPIEDSEDI